MQSSHAHKKKTRNVCWKVIANSIMLIKTHSGYETMPQGGLFEYSCWIYFYNNYSMLVAFLKSKCF